MQAADVYEADFYEADFYEDNASLKDVCSKLANRLRRHLRNGVPQPASRMETFAVALGVSVDSYEAALARRCTEATSFAEKVPIPPAGWSVPCCGRVPDIVATSCHARIGVFTFTPC